MAIYALQKPVFFSPSYSHHVYAIAISSDKLLENLAHKSRFDLNLVEFTPRCIVQHFIYPKYPREMRWQLIPSQNSVYTNIYHRKHYVLCRASYICVLQRALVSDG